MARRKAPLLLPPLRCGVAGGAVCAMTVMTRRSELASAAILMRAMKSRGQCRNSRPTGAPRQARERPPGMEMEKEGRGRSGEIKLENKGGGGREGGRRGDGGGAGSARQSAAAGAHDSNGARRVLITSPSPFRTSLQHFGGRGHHSRFASAGFNSTDSPTTNKAILFHSRSDASFPPSQIPACTFNP